MNTTPIQRIRLVAGNPTVYGIYLRNFLHRPEAARMLDSVYKLRGLKPDKYQVVALPGWQADTLRFAGLFSEIMDWRIRWREIGFEEITEAELIGGLPVRKENLLKEYNKRVDGCGSNSIAIGITREWIMSLDAQDGSLLLDAINEREKALKEPPKIIHGNPLPPKPF